MLKKWSLSTKFPFISQGASISNYSKLLEVQLNIIKYPRARLNRKVFNNENTDFFFLSNKIKNLFSYTIPAQIPPSFIKYFLGIPTWINISFWILLLCLHLLKLLSHLAHARVFPIPVSSIVLFACWE